MSPMFDIREPSIDAMRAAPVYFRYGSNKRRILIDGLTAQAVLTCYAALSAEHQAKFERMVAGGPNQLTKIVSFCWKHVRRDQCHHHSYSPSHGTFNVSSGSRGSNCFGGSDV